MARSHTLKLHLKSKYPRVKALGKSTRCSLLFHCCTLETSLLVRRVLDNGALIMLTSFYVYDKACDTLVIKHI